MVKKASQFAKNGTKAVDFFNLPEVKDFIMVHNYENIEWFNKERFELLLCWIMIDRLFHNIEEKQDFTLPEIDDYVLKIERILELSAMSGYQYQRFLSFLTDKANSL
jgi:hypothetical protein